MREWVGGELVRDGRFYVAGVSIGAMMPLHIMAKNTQGRDGKRIYPYQAMIKGFIPISTCIIPVQFSKFQSLAPFFTKHGPKIMGVLSRLNGPIIHDKSNIDKIIDNKVKCINITFSSPNS